MMRGLITGAALALALALGAGCGGGSSTGTGTSTTTTGGSGVTDAGNTMYTLTGQERPNDKPAWKSYPAVTVTCGPHPALSDNPSSLPPKLVCTSISSYIQSPTQPCSSGTPSQGPPGSRIGRVLIVQKSPAQAHAVLSPFENCNLSAAEEQRDTIIAAAAFRTSPG